MKSPFTPRQRRVIAALVLAYSSAYVCRTNISMMLPGIMEELQLSQARAGTMTTLFAAIYAVGQVVNGLIVDRVNPRLWIFAGLTVSAACNLLCAFAPSFTLLLVLWSLNAVAQSMLWTPVVRVTAQRFEAEGRSRASFMLSFALIFGNLAAWGVSALLVARAGWRAAFACCAAVTFAVAVTTTLMLRGEPNGRAESRPREAKQKAAAVSLGQLVLGTGLAMVLFGCLFNGFVRDSVMTWAPTILMETQGIDLNSVLGVALIIPVVNFFGVMLGRFCYNKLGRMARRAVALLMLGCAVASLALTLLAGLSPLVCAVLLACCVAMAYGLNPLLTSVLPLEYYGLGRVGTVAGLVDAFIYLGSSLSGVLTGALAERTGWQTVFLVWTIGALIGAVAIGVAALPKFMDKLFKE